MKASHYSLGSAYMQGMTPTAQNTKHGFLKQENEETQSTQKIVILNKNIDMRSGSSDLG